MFEKRYKKLRRMCVMNNADMARDDEIDLLKLFKALWKKIWVIIQDIASSNYIVKILL